MTTAMKRLQQDKWLIDSQTQKGTQYTVTLISNCSTCKLQCTNCNACIHMYICTCLDSITHTTVCKHVHIHFTHKSRHEEHQEISKDSIEKTCTNNDIKWDNQYS